LALALALNQVFGFGLGLAVPGLGLVPWGLVNITEFLVTMLLYNAPDIPFRVLYLHCSYEFNSPLDCSS